MIHSKNIPNTSDPISVPFPRRNRWDPDCAGRTGPCASRLVPGTQRERANARDGSGAFGAGGARAGRLTEPRIARMCKAISLWNRVHYVTLTCGPCLNMRGVY